jgi:hypothetical protein
MGFNPNPKLIKVSDADASVPQRVHQVLAESQAWSAYASLGSDVQYLVLDLIRGHRIEEN